MPVCVPELLINASNSVQCLLKVCVPKKKKKKQKQKMNLAAAGLNSFTFILFTVFFVSLFWYVADCFCLSHSLAPSTLPLSHSQTLVYILYQKLLRATKYAEQPQLQQKNNNNKTKQTNKCAESYGAGIK